MPLILRWSVLVGALALALTSGATACGDRIDSGPEPVDSTVHAVTVSPPGPVAINVGTKMTFSASVDAGAGVTDRRVSWSSSNTHVATVDQTGVVTADSVGTTVINAASTADRTVYGTVTVNVAALVSPSAERHPLRRGF